jgi:hypothetical protein
MNHINFTDIKMKAFYAVNILQVMNRLAKEDNVPPLLSFSMKPLAATAMHQNVSRSVTPQVIHFFRPLFHMNCGTLVAR